MPPLGVTMLRPGCVADEGVLAGEAEFPSARRREAPSGPKPRRGSYRAGCMVGGIVFGAVGMLAGLVLAGMLKPGNPALLETPRVEGQLSSLAAPAPTHNSSQTPVVGAEGTIEVGEARLGGTNSTGLGALGAKDYVPVLGAGGRTWPLVFLIGRHKAASTSIAQMMFDTHLFCRPYTENGDPFKEVRFLVEERNWEKGMG